MEEGETQKELSSELTGLNKGEKELRKNTPNGYSAQRFYFFYYSHFVIVYIVILYLIKKFH